MQVLQDDVLQLPGHDKLPRFANARVNIMRVAKNIKKLQEI